MEIELIAADRLPLSMLTELWNSAFSGYYVPMELTLDRFARLVQRELISLPDSLVAVMEGKPIGFALAALRWQGDRLLAYDAGTAVLPEHRQQGIASRLMRALSARLATIGAESVSLTAVSENLRAIDLYKRMGLLVHRQLTCFQRAGLRQTSWQPVKGLSVQSVPASRAMSLLTACYRQSPEWQNNPGGAKLQQCRAFLATWQDQTVGYAVFAGQEPIYLLQLGVLPEWRRHGFGRALLNAVLSTSPGSRCVYLNHPEEEEEGAGLLTSMGFEVLLRQVEMCSELTSGWRPRLAETEDVSLIGPALSEVGSAAGAGGADLADIWLLDDDGGELLGLVGANSRGAVALLSSLWVRPDHRGTGLGRRLLEHLERWLCSQGCTDVYLQTSEQQMIFLHLGYRLVRPEQLPEELGQLVERRDCCPLTTVVMHKSL